MNALDSTIAWFSPKAALQRAQARRALAYYEGAKPSKQRAKRQDASSPNTLVGQGPPRCGRTRASSSAITTSAVAPARDGQQRGRPGRHRHRAAAAPRRRQHPCRLRGHIARGLARLAARARVTRRLRWPLAQRLLAYTWLRDGEVFAQQLIGSQLLEHGTRVPYSLELLEPDFIPLDFDDAARNITRASSATVGAGPPCTGRTRAIRARACRS